MGDQVKAINGISLRDKTQQETLNLIKESGRTARITLTKSHDSGHMTQSASQMTRVDHPVARNPSSSLEDELEKSGVRVSKR